MCEENKWGKVQKEHSKTNRYYQGVRSVISLGIAVISKALEMFFQCTRHKVKPAAVLKNISLCIKKRRNKKSEKAQEWDVNSYCFTF